MNFRRLHFDLASRRRTLRAKADVLRLESRTTITEPISFTGMALSVMGPMFQLGFMYPEGASNALRSLSAPRTRPNRRATRAPSRTRSRRTCSSPSTQSR